MSVLELLNPRKIHLDRITTKLSILLIFCRSNCKNNSIPGCISRFTTHRPFRLICDQRDDLSEFIENKRTMHFSYNGLTMVWLAMLPLFIHKNLRYISRKICNATHELKSGQIIDSALTSFHLAEFLTVVNNHSISFVVL